MSESTIRVGFLHDGPLSDEAAAALDWLERRGHSAHAVSFEDLERPGDRFDVLWWHRSSPVGPDAPLRAAAGTVESFLDDGGGLLLSLRAMGSVDALDVETTPPDAVGRDDVPERTGVLWRSAYDDHRAVDAFDSLRIHTCDTGPVPFARYEDVLPARGEVLAGTVRGDRDVPGEMTVVSWNAGDGAVIGVGGALAFDGQDDRVAENRSELAAGCLRSLADGGSQPGRPETADQLRALRRRLGDDPHRPRYHLTPPANWLNDPNGLIRWNGRYHVFYQYNPAGPFHNTIHWGHAVSDDLVRWEDRPVALAPSPDGPDRDGCWSGCAVDDDGTATVVYTGGRGRDQLPCLATSEDDSLDDWRKYDDNPVVEEPPAEPDLLESDHWNAEFRDHSVWREDDTWFQVIGSGLADGGGVALLYSSPDLRDWSYEGPLLRDDGGPPGTVWECPELLDLGDRHLLHVSNYDETVYFLGRVRDGEFEVDARGTLDHGDFYAPQSMRDGDRYLTWGWIPETRGLAAQWDAGWSGALTLPRVLDTDSRGRLRQRPAPEVAELRERELPVPATLDLEAGERCRLDASGRALELQLEVALDDADAFELSVLESPNREERTAIRYTADDELLVDGSRSGAEREGVAEPRPIEVTPYDEPLSLRAFLDGSVVELYANDRHCLTTRAYPTRDDSTGLSVAADGGSARVRSLSAWELGSAELETDAGETDFD